ncbi:ABC transporter permease [Corynebacterium comes]|uniref:ABC-2 family transporter protein n=1 Tax=Corynebacterium comes TaxID=2675218 RepID=A0A6B8VLD6_9CORY|nr:polyketide antibiotic transporter [Corynebacterium comes]QGU04883.1 ABC-2 family transporter protein [Corynebacterium comes]
MTTQFTGTGRLLRLYLRLDRFRLPVWVLSMFVVVWASVDALQTSFSDPLSLQARGMLGANPATVMMSGPVFGLENYTMGLMVASELSLWAFIVAAVMGVLFMVRHTRADEESGRLEMLRALPVGRMAAPTASMILVALASVALGGAVSAGLLIPGMRVPDSLAFGLGTALTGMVFGAAAAVAAQLSDSARAASGLGIAAIVATFLIRAAGDVIDYQGSWLSWFSPLAWPQQTRLYADLRWWPLALSAVAALALAALAFWLVGRRDLGSGMGHGRPGPARASARLLSPAGLASRLESPTFLIWAVGLFSFAVAFGTLADELEDVIDVMPALDDWVVLDLTDLTSSFGAMLLSYLSLGPAILLVLAVLHLRTEEREGRMTSMFLSGSSQWRLLAGWFAVVAAEAAAVLILLGFGLGVGIALGSGDARWIGDMTAASFVYLPAVLLHGTLAVMVFGLAPRLIAFTWFYLAWAILVLFLGELLRLPDWARSTTPVWHTPAVPGTEVDPLPLIIMTLLALAFLVLGLVGFRRRDLVEG